MDAFFIEDEEIFKKYKDIWNKFNNNMKKKLIENPPTIYQKTVLFASMKGLSNDEKSFLFHLKTSFRSQNV